MESGVLEQIAAHIGKLSKPIPFSTLGKEARKSGIQIKNRELEKALEELIREGRVFRHPPSTSRQNASPCCFSKSPLQYTKELFLRILKSLPQWTENQLREKIPKAYREQFDEALGNLKNADLLFERKKGRKKVINYLTSIPPRPTDYLTSQRKKSLQETLTMVNEHRRNRLDFEVLLNFLDGEAQPQPQKLDQDLSEELLVRWYGEDLTKRGGLRSMPIYLTWEHYERWCSGKGLKPNVDLFHHLLQEMEARNAIAFTPHNAPRDVPPDEVAILRRDNQSRLLYYWTVLR